MNFSRKAFNALLFMCSMTLTITIGNTFAIERINRMVKEFEPVTVERVRIIEIHEQEQPKETEVLASEVVETEVQIMTPVESVDQVEPVTEVTEVTEPIPARIECSLDDQTQQMILERCEELGLDFGFVMALIYRESSFNPNADSGSSVGLMQVNRINHGWLSKDYGLTDFFNPEQNVKAGTIILKNLFDKYENPRLVLMAYNMGESGARKKWNNGVYSTDYAESVIRLADKYNREIAERMDGNDQM